jgi:hypothetical protein
MSCGTRIGAKRCLRVVRKDSRSRRVCDLLGVGAVRLGLRSVARKLGCELKQLRRAGRGEEKEMHRAGPLKGDVGWAKCALAMLVGGGN